MQPDFLLLLKWSWMQFAKTWMDKTAFFYVLQFKMRKCSHYFPFEMLFDRKEAMMRYRNENKVLEIRAQPQ